MKKLLKTIFLPILLLGMALLLMGGCEEKDDVLPANLDESLVGTWSFTDSDGDVLSWTFNKNGTCVQTVYGTNYNWKWAVEEEGVLKLYVDGGTPSYRRYRIETGRLYLYVDGYGWGLPFVKG